MSLSIIRHMCDTIFLCHQWSFQQRIRISLFFSAIGSQTQIVRTYPFLFSVIINRLIQQKQITARYSQRLHGIHNAQTESSLIIHCLIQFPYHQRNQPGFSLKIYKFLLLLCNLMTKSLNLFCCPFFIERIFLFLFGLLTPASAGFSYDQPGRIPAEWYFFSIQNAEHILNSQLAHRTPILQYRCQRRVRSQ